jgi:phosphoglycerol transferase
MRKILPHIYIPLLFFVAAFIFCSALWTVSTFGRITADQVLFQARMPVSGAESNLVLTFVLHCLLPAVSIALLSLIPFHLLKLSRKNSLFSVSAGILIIAALIFMAAQFQLFSYIKTAAFASTFIEDNYVDPRSVTLDFPEQKRNLIYIFMESMETSFYSKELGGALETNLMPELAALTQANTNFSHNADLGGTRQVLQTGWTAAALISQHSGLPLRLPANQGFYGDFQFLPGAFTLGDILHTQGYNQSLIFGSDASYSGRSAFYTQHGDFRILDINTAESDGITPPDYREWWGFEDRKLYTYAKQELNRLAAADAPFHLTLLTADTHTYGGYVCPLCREEYDEQYFNVISCANRQIAAFVAWAEKQDFYENTTIIIVGDHLSMEPSLLDYIPADYTRTAANVIINPAASTDNTNNRLFTPVDMFPTTLAAMGVTIEGERLALGTNLFSPEPTLAEKNGLDAVNRGFAGRSEFYNNFFN